MTDNDGDKRYVHLLEKHEKNPKDDIFCYLLAEECVTLKRDGEALGHYAEALRLNSNEAEFHFSRGSLLARLGRHDEAATDFTEAIRLDPLEAWYYVERSKSLKSLGKHSDALRDRQHLDSLLAELEMPKTPTFPDEANIVFPSEEPNLQAAIDRCPEGGSILVEPGRHVIPKTVRLEKTIRFFNPTGDPDDVLLYFEGKNDSSRPCGLVIADGQARFEGISFELECQEFPIDMKDWNDGYPSTLWLEECDRVVYDITPRKSSETAGESGCVFIYGAEPSFENCQFLRQKHFGVVVSLTGRPIFRLCAFLDCGSGGALVFGRGEPDVSLCRFRNSRFGIRIMMEGKLHSVRNRFEHNGCGISMVNRIPISHIVDQALTGRSGKNLPGIEVIVDTCRFHHNKCGVELYGRFQLMIKSSTFDYNVRGYDTGMWSLSFRRLQDKPVFRFSGSLCFLAKRKRGWTSSSREC